MYFVLCMEMLNKLSLISMFLSWQLLLKCSERDFYLSMSQFKLRWLWMNSGCPFQFYHSSPHTNMRIHTHILTYPLPENGAGTWRWWMEATINANNCIQGPFCLTDQRLSLTWWKHNLLGHISAAVQCQSSVQTVPYFPVYIFCLLLLCVLETSKVISERVLTCDSANSFMVTL